MLNLSYWVMTMALYYYIIESFLTYHDLSSSFLAGRPVQRRSTKPHPSLTNIFVLIRLRYIKGLCGKKAPAPPFTCIDVIQKTAILDSNCLIRVLLLKILYLLGGVYGCSSWCKVRLLFNVVQIELDMGYSQMRDYISAWIFESL